MSGTTFCLSGLRTCYEKRQRSSRPRQSLEHVIWLSSEQRTRFDCVSQDALNRSEEVIERNEHNQPVGQSHHWARWTDAEVRWILELHADGMSYRKISAKLEIPVSTVAAICRGDIRPQTNLWRDK